MCEVAGISKRTLYTFFGSKDELIARSVARRDLEIRNGLLGQRRRRRPTGLPP